MKKIEKIGMFVVPTSADEFVVDTLAKVAEKTDEIIDQLNKQPEWTDKGGFQKGDGKLYRDSTEEWEEKLILGDEGEREYIVNFIKQLLKEREARAFRDGLNTAARLANAILGDELSN